MSSAIEGESRMIDRALQPPEASIIPSELTGQLPRRLQATGQGTYLTLVTVAFLAFAVASALWGGMNAVQQIEHRSALRRDSAEAIGTITRIRNGKNNKTIFYTFTVDGTPFTGKAELPWQLRKNIEGSNSLNIRYLPAHPDVNYPAAWEWSFFWWLPLSTDLVHLPDFSPELGWLFASLLWGVGGLAFLLVLRSERRLLAEGAPAAAVVTKCCPTNRGNFLLNYEFRAEDGRMVTGNCTDSFKEIGANCCVLYLPQNPRKNMSYPSSCYRVVQ
jgi:hypothetical protein